MDAEDDRAQALRPERRAIRAHRHVWRRVAFGLEIEDELLRLCAGRQILKADHVVQLVFEGLVLHAAQDCETIAVFRPCQALIRRFSAVERHHRAGRHVAKLHAVGRHFGRVDGERHPVAFLVERELGDIARVQFIAARQLAQDQIGTLCLLPFGSVAVHRDPTAALAREREPTDLFELGLGRRRQFDQNHFVARLFFSPS